VEQKKNLLAEEANPLALQAHWHSAVLAGQNLAMVAVAQLRAKLPEGLRLAAQPVFLLQSARVYQYWTDRGPFVPVRALPADQKYNRAVRCGAQPISGEVMALRRGDDRHPRRRNRAGFADCGNRCTRSPRKSAGRGRPCPISERDKCRCLLHPSAG